MTKAELTQKWEAVIGYFTDKNPQEKLLADSFFRVLEPVKVSEKEGKLYLAPPFGRDKGFFLNMVKKNQEDLMEGITSVFGKPYIAEVTDSATPDNEDPYEAEDPLDPRYTFEAFVVGNNNMLAYSAAVSVAESFSKKYNPLFLYGGSGLGKTHLMHAIAHYVRQNKPRKKFLYVSAETFINELSEAIRTKTQQQFKNKYRKVDYLLFDDVQFIAGKNAATEELFNTFDALDNANKQIVFTSDRPPKELADIPERLVARFSQGLPIDIQPPEYETRLAIIKNKAIVENLNINDPNLISVMEVIAGNIESNIRELEGAFTRVVAHSSLSGEQITVNLAKKVLTEVFGTKNKEATPAIIKKTVANYFGIKVADMESPKRSRNIAYPRQIAIYLIREISNNKYSLPQIGELFGGRDHTTILHSYEKICDELKTSPELRATIETIKSQIEEY